MKTAQSNRNERKYIYAVHFANSIIQAGCRCVETGYNAKAQKFFWAFERDEIQAFYRMLDKGDRGVMRDEYKNISKSKSQCSA